MPSTPILAKKLQAYGITMTEHLTVSDGLEQVAAAIAEMRKKPVDMILCTGGMSVDPDDNTPGAIARSGARIVTYGAAVLPGAMFLLGYYEDGQPVMGLPGCVMYAKATILDLILPRVAAGLQVTNQEIAVLDSYLKWELELGEPLGAFGGPILWVSHELGGSGTPFRILRIIPDAGHAILLLQPEGAAEGRRSCARNAMQPVHMPPGRRFLFPSGKKSCCFSEPLDKISGSCYDGSTLKNGGPCHADRNEEMRPSAPRDHRPMLRRVAALAAFLCGSDRYPGGISGSEHGRHCHCCQV